MHQPSMRDFFSIRDELNRTTVEFLRTDLDTGLMLAQIATGSRNNSDRQKRNIRKARQAYDTVIKFRSKIRMSTEANNALEEKIGRLRSMLEVLGETFA